MSMGAYQVGAVEAVLQARLDDKNFDKFDRAVKSAKRSVDSMTKGQEAQARAMKKAGASTSEIARKLGVTERATESYTRATDKSTRAALLFQKAGSKMRTAMSKLATAVKYASLAIVGLAAIEIPRLVRAYQESYKVGRQTNAVIKSTGGAANITAKEVERLATAISKKTGIDDEQIQATENMLLTFTKIRNEAGKNNDIFNQTTQATLDLAKATGTDLTGAAKQVGKAMNDPATGLTALRRSGASFDEQQTETIKKLFETGKAMEAQKMILKELDREFGGSAVAQGDPFDKLKVSVENVEEAMGKALFPLFSEIADEAEKQFGKIETIMSSDKLTGDQKFDKIFNIIAKAFDRALDQINKRIPQMAEIGGKVGLKLAGGIVKGFINAPILGKLLIAAWLIKAFGGWGALGGMGARAGGRLGKALGMHFLKAVAPYFAVEAGANGLGAAFAARMPRFSKFAGKWGGRAGRAFGLAFITLGVSVLAEKALNDKAGLESLRNIGLYWGQQVINGLIAAVNVGIRSINETLNKYNILGKMGVSAPQIGEIGNVNFDPYQEERRRRVKRSRKKVNRGWRPGDGLPQFGAFPRGKHEGGLVGMATGGRVPGLDPRDTVPAMLEPGEFVLKKRTVDKLGVPFLRSLNDKGEVAKEAEEGKKKIGKTFEELGKDAKKKTEKTEKDVVKNFKDMRTKATTSQRTLKQAVTASWRDINQNHSERTAEMDKTTGTRFRSMLTTVKKRGGDMRDSIEGTMSNLQDAVNEGFGNISTTTNKALKAFGVEPVNFGVSETKKKHAGGGFIAGQGKQDTVPLVMGMAAPGEAILSGPQQAEVENSLSMTRALGLGNYGSLDSLFTNVTTPHYAFARGGFMDKARRFAKGGLIWPTKSHTVTSGFGARSSPGGVGSTNHDGIDIGVGDGTPVFASGAGHVVTAAPNGGYGNYVELAHSGGYNSFYGHLMKWLVRPGQRVAQGQQIALSDNTGASTGPHLHFGVHKNGSAIDPLSVLGGGPLGGVSVEKVKQMLLSGPDGPLKSMGQAALDKVRKAANKYIGKKMPVTTAGGPAGNDQLTAWLTQALKFTGHYSPANLQALIGRAMQESGGNPRAINLWDSNAAAGHPSKGLLQTIDSTFDAYKAKGHGDIWNPVDNAIAAINYMFGRYGHIMGPSGSGYARGGRIPGFAKGGRFVREAAPILMRGGLAHRAAAAVLGNSYGESGWDTESMEPGTNNGGAFGFTASPVSLPDMQRYAEKQGLPWTSTKAQIQFMLHDLKGRLPGTFRKMNGQSIPDATSTFMHEWERPANYSSLGKRIGAGFRASKIMRSLPGAKPDKPEKLLPLIRPNALANQAERLRKRSATARKNLAAKKAKWERFKKAWVAARKSAAESITLPKLLDPFRPKIAGQDAILGAHSPIGSDLGAYNVGYGALGGIDSELHDLRDQYLGTFDDKRSVFNQQEAIRKRRETAIARMKAGMKRQLGLELSGVSGGVRVNKKGKPIKNVPLRGRAARRVKAANARAIKAKTAAIRKKYNPSAPMNRLVSSREDIQTRFDALSERGATVADLLSQAQANVKNTVRVSSAGSRALRGFARGGRIGQPVAMRPPVVQVTLADPTLAALNPHVEVIVDGKIAQQGQQTKQRQRRAGSTGRRATF